MPPMLWGAIAAPFAGFLLLICLGRRFQARVSAVIGVGSVGIAAILAVWAAVSFLLAGSESWSNSLGSWLRAGSLDVELSIWYDGLSLVMTIVVTVVGFLIHLYSVGYMHGDEGYHRYFAYLNLFIASMLLLVLAGNLLVLFVGWELVGLCSFLLIGFWHREPANAKAARKAFIVTRFGDAGIAVAIALLFASLGTLDIRAAGALAGGAWPSGGAVATAVAACLLIGAVGKSAQLPLQVWLPDAMAGPTPVSALIHAATMVTAGVYLVARTHVLFELAPAVLEATAWIGVATLLVAGLAALVQSDLKRTLAYSTISQIGYMFLCLGAGTWGAAVFHLFTHAIFKALLFLGAGAVMHATGEQDMRKLGGLRRELPAVFFCFLAGASALAAVPLVTEGFYSKEWMLESLWAAGTSWRILWGVAVAGAFVTAFYSFRMVALVFFGPARGHAGAPAARRMAGAPAARGPAARGPAARGPAEPGPGDRTPVRHRPGPTMLVPLVVLALASVLAGFLRTPAYLGNIGFFERLMSGVFPESAGQATGAVQILPDILSSLTVLAGAALALLLYRRPRRAAVPEAKATGLRRLLGSGFGFDALYERLFVRPFGWITTANRNDVVDAAIRGVALLNVGMHRLLAATQSGKLRWYLLGASIGIAIILGVEVLR